jgi:transposase
MESTGNYWCGLYDGLEQSGIDVSLANPLKTRPTAEAKIKSDKIDSSVLSDPLQANLIVKSYIPPQEIREIRRTLLRQREKLL